MQIQMMEMNRRYIVYAMMATIVTLSSCAGEESEAEQSPPVPISVTVNSDHQPLTRNDETTPLTSTTLQSTGFGLYCQPKSSTATYSPIMNNQKFTHNGSGWTYSPTKYWPNDNNTKLNFIAYAPYTTTKASYDNANSKFTYNYTINTTSPFDNIDLCTAVTPNRTSSDDDGKVPLTFQHQTARLDVQVGINNATSGSKYFIQSVSIVTNSHNPETLHVGLSGDPSWTAESGASTLSYTISSFPVGIADPGTSLTAGNFGDMTATLSSTATRVFPDAKYLTILPSTSSVDITVQYVEYSVSATTGLVESTVRTKTSSDVSLSDVTGGHRYTLNVTLDPSTDQP